MIATAKRNYPNINFRHGDAENLAFKDASFDAVICAFGILHMPQPQKAVAEAFRVLKSGGRYAFTAWASADKNEFFEIVLPAIKTHANMDVPLPEARQSFFTVTTEPVARHRRTQVLAILMLSNCHFLLRLVRRNEFLTCSITERCEHPRC